MARRARMAKWRRHSVEFKRQVVERMKICENIQSLARELKLERKLLYTWKYQLEGRPEPRHANLGRTAEERKDKELENDFFESALLRIKEVRQQSLSSGASASTTSSSRGRKSKAR